MTPEENVQIHETNAHVAHVVSQVQELRATLAALGLNDLGYRLKCYSDPEPVGTREAYKVKPRRVGFRDENGVVIRTTLHRWQYENQKGEAELAAVCETY